MQTKTTPEDISTPKTVGIFEQVGFPKYGIFEVTAKIDTGAYTGALHCTNIEIETVDNGKILSFSPFDHPDIKISLDNFMVKFVKSSNGIRQQRYFIETTVTIEDEEYPIILSLADRSEMKWPVLIGRRFLKKNNLIIDPNKGKS